VSTIIIAIGRLLRLSILIFTLASTLHFLYQVCKKFLELLVLLPNLHYLRLNHLYSCGVTAYLIFYFQNLFKNDLTDFIKALHICLFRFVLLECEFVFKLMIS